jgi:hypothetical protein
LINFGGNWNKWQTNFPKGNHGVFMDINFNFFDPEGTKKILLKLTHLEKEMATLQDIKNEVAGITDAVAAQHASFDLLVTEVRQLLA